MDNFVKLGGGSGATRPLPRDGVGGIPRRANSQATP